jgi:hypothetical protein
VLGGNALVEACKHVDSQFPVDAVVEHLLQRTKRRVVFWNLAHRKYHQPFGVTAIPATVETK